MKTKAFLVAYCAAHTVTDISQREQICCWASQSVSDRQLKTCVRVSGQVCSGPSGKKDLEGF